MSANDWLGVELRHFAALEAVARTRSFGGAARELGYTQSAVSQQIAQLERIVGQQLFNRPGGPRRVEPTEAGLLLLGHADAIVARLDAARADMAALAEGSAGTLRVGIYQSVGARLLPALVRRFRAGRVPELNVIFRTDDNGTLGALVAEDLGAAIEPRLVVDPRDRAVKMLPFGSRIPPRTLVLAWHRDRYRSRAAEAFVALAQELAQA